MLWDSDGDGRRNSVDGALIHAGASHKSFRPKGGGDDDPSDGGGRNSPGDWQGNPRPNVTDPDARLFKKTHHTAAILAHSWRIDRA